MRFNRRQGNFLRKIIGQWESDGTVTPEVAKTLQGSFAIRSFDWARLAKYSFIVAVICAIISLSAMLADQYLIDLMHRLFTAPDTFLFLLFAGAAALVFYIGLRKRRRHPEKTFGNEAVLFVAVVFAAVAIVFLGKLLDRGTGHFSLLLLLAAVLYGAIGYWYDSTLVWTFSLLSLGSWFGAETGYISGWGAYFLGMNYPLRFVVFGAVLIGVSFLFKAGAKTVILHKSTYVIGLLYLFLALWIMSIFGNYDDIDRWYRADNTELLHWSVIFGLVSLAAIYWGLKRDDGAAQGFGLTFLFINLYTKFFEYFWDTTHKAVFFLILAVSFWLIGRKAETIWNLEFVKKSINWDAEGEETE